LFKTEGKGGRKTGGKRHRQTPTRPNDRVASRLYGRQYYGLNCTMQKLETSLRLGDNKGKFLIETEKTKTLWPGLEEHHKRNKAQGTGKEGKGI